jgi:hypothetical protein
MVFNGRARSLTRRLALDAFGSANYAVTVLNPLAMAFTNWVYQNQSLSAFICG